MEAKLKVFQMNLEGEVGPDKMAEIDRVVGQLIRGDMVGLILNFETVEHVHFAILPSLVEQRKRLQSFGGDLRLAGLSDYLKNIFKTTGVLDAFPVFTTAQQAVKSFGVSKAATNLPLGL